MYEYQKTHPWITFSLKLSDPNLPLWMNLGAAASKCEHIAGVALDPAIAKNLLVIYLAKGVNATTAIEGNTLTEQQVIERVKGELRLPLSQEYLGQEVDNVIAACNKVAKDSVSGKSTHLTVDQIKNFNKMILHGLEVESHVVPGEIRECSVVVGGGKYRGAPWQDCDYLLNRFCDWMNGPDFQSAALPQNVLSIIKAIVAHVYIAWIHPFGDGNGRTARLIELQILLSAGVPVLSCQLLSNHYNLTRSMYYHKLDEASRNGGNLVPFLEYAVQGFVDQLKLQIADIQTYQLELAWQNYVHEQFKGRSTKADERRRWLVMDLSKQPMGISVAQVPELSTRLAASYANKTSRAVVRDLTVLKDMGIVEFFDNKKRVRAKSEIIKAFLPTRRSEKSLKSR